jgi:GntR family transcriptional regulator, carbon starvation induced regulator
MSRTQYILLATVAKSTTKQLRSRTHPAHPKQGPVGGPTLFDQLRADILSCRLQPSERLLFRELAQKYGSGMSRLRETLVRLGADGLVVSDENRGFRVAPVSRDELLDLIQMRSELEALAIRLAIEKGDLRWEADIIARHHEVSRIPVFDEDSRLSERWDEANAAFHHSLYAACGSPLLINFCDLLRERYGRYRRLWAAHSNPTAETARDHEKLVRAVTAKDAATAVPLIRAHFDRTARQILRHWSEAAPDEIA